MKRSWKGFFWMLTTLAVLLYAEASVRAQEVGPQGTQQGATSRDARLQRQLEEQLAADRAFADVKVSVNRGVVFLDGAVASEKDKQRARNFVRVFPGVKEVDERLALSPQMVDGASATTANDGPQAASTEASQVATEIASAIADEPTLAKRHISVAVHGDTLELTGSVRSKKERARAVEIANSFAVHSHVVDKLTLARQ